MKIVWIYDIGYRSWTLCVGERGLVPCLHGELKERQGGELLKRVGDGFWRRVPKRLPDRTKGGR